MLDSIPLYKNPFAIFLVFLFVIANLLQLPNPEGMGRPGSIFDYFTSILLWFLSLASFSLGARPQNLYWRRLFWFAASLGMAILAMDEILEIHERTSRGYGVNDDYYKVFLWMCAGIAIVILVKMEKPASNIIRMLAFGYFLNSVYMVVELADELGFEYSRGFTDFLRYTEEELEMLFLMTYLVAFVYLSASFYIRR